MAVANKLVIKTAFAKVPPMYSQDGKGDDAIAHAKVFSPQSGWRWYIIEYDPETGEAFGLVQGHEIELGTFALNHPRGVDSWGGEDMQSQNDKWRGRYPYPPFERDLHFKPTTIGKIRESLAGVCPA